MENAERYSFPSHDTDKQVVGCFPYVIAGASFIPLFGVLLGIVAIVWGIAKRAWPLAILGVCGILFTASIYSSLFYFGFYRRGLFRSDTVVTLLSDAVKDIEFYKLQHGRYPASLSELESTEKSGEVPKAVDPTFTQRGSDDIHFYYRPDQSGSSYILRSVGADGVPFTSDDIVPPFSADERKNIGLRVIP